MGITKREGECTEGVFWDCVAEIGWPVKSTTLTKADILRAWTPEFGTSFRKLMEAKVSEVYNIVEREERRLDENMTRSTTRDSYYLSDDGLSDFCNHIVGMGWAVFNDETRHPEKLFKRAAARDYEESFSYVVPYEPSWQGKTFEEFAEGMGYDLQEENFSSHRMDDRNFEEYMASIRESYMETTRGDWRNIEAEHYARWAERILPYCAAFLAELEPTTPVQDEQMAAEFASVLTRYLTLLVHEKTEEALEFSEDALRAWWGLYHIAEDIGALRSAHKDLLPMCGNGTYGGENLINDHRQYMGGLEGFRCRFHLKEIRRKTEKAS